METKIIFADIKLKETFENLEYSDKKFYDEIQKALREINQDKYCGRQVIKKLIPKIIIQRFKF